MSPEVRCVWVQRKLRRFSLPVSGTVLEGPARMKGGLGEM